MTLQVNSQFITDFFAGFLGTTGLGTSTNSRISIFSGAIPDVTTGFVFAAANYDAQKLAVASSFTLQNTNRTIRFNAVPTPNNAIKTGTATWFALFNSSTTTYAGNAILGTITDQVDGSGVLVLESVNLVLGAPVNIIELGIRIF